MKIIHKLALNTVGIALLVTSVTFVGIGFIWFNVNEIVKRENPKVQAAFEMEINAKKAAASIIDYLTHEGLEEEKEQFWHDAGEFQEFHDQYVKHMRTGEEEKLLSQVDILFAELKEIAGELFELKDEQDKLIEDRGVIFDDKVEVVLDEKLARLGHGNYEKDIAGKEMQISIHEMISATRRYMATGKSFLKDRITDSEQDYFRAEKTYAALELNAEEQNIFNELKGYWEKIVLQTSEIIRLEDKKRELLKALEENGHKVDNILDEQIQTIAMSKIKAGETRTLAVISTVLGTIIVICFLAIIVSAYISRSISMPIQELGVAVAKIGKGDLDTRIEIKSKDEIGQLASSFNQMTKDLKTTTASRDELNASNQKLQAEITSRKQAEEESFNAHQKLIEQQQHEAELVEAKFTLIRRELVRNTRLAAIGQVSASIAHDLRNPLGAMRNAAYLLNRHLSKDEPKLLDYTDIIHQEVAKADQIITNLLEMVGAKPPRKRAVDLGQIIEEVEQARKSEGVACRISVAPDPFVVRADKGQLRQVIDNIFSNSVYAMAGQGSFFVEASRDSDYDTVVLRDTGPGFAPEVRERLFEALVTTKASGIGLGLTICRQIIEKHGGTIEADEHSSQGAVFRIRLPRS